MVDQERFVGSYLQGLSLWILTLKLFRRYILTFYFHFTLNESGYVMGKCNAVSGIYRVNLLLSSFGKLIHELVGKGLHFYESLFLRFYVAILWLVVRKKVCGNSSTKNFFSFSTWNGCYNILAKT